MCKIICITNRKIWEENKVNNTYLNHIEKIALAKPDYIILREKDLSASEYLNLSKEVINICNNLNVNLILHNFADVALSLNHKAIHLPLDGLLELSGNELSHFDILGASCHSVSDLIKAKEKGCTYITASHIFETNCKKGLPPRGLDFLREICSIANINVYGLGGIKAFNAKKVIDAGANGICIMGDFMTEPSPTDFINKLKFNIQKGI